MSPGITLTATLLDYSGSQLGSIAKPAYLRIALCGYGQMLPRVSGVGMIGKSVSWPGDIPYTGSALNVKLWGNDVLTPSNTYYSIAVLDENRNVIQSGLYQFSGTQTIDLSAAPQVIPSVPPPPITPTVLAGSVTVPYSATPSFNCALVPAGLISFDITLAGNVTLSAVQNAQPGQIVTFYIAQDGIGGRTFAWPGSVKNASTPDPTPGAISVQCFNVRANGNLYPIGPMTVN